MSSPATLIKVLSGSQKFYEQLPAPWRAGVATKSNQKFENICPSEGQWWPQSGAMNPNLQLPYQVH